MMAQIFTAIATILLLGSANHPAISEPIAPAAVLQDDKPIPLPAELERDFLEPAIPGLE